MEEKSQPYRFKISLRLVHPSEDLSTCSTEFVLEPSRQWKVGDPRTTPSGNPLDGTWRESYWTSPLNTGAGKDLESALAQVAEWLEGHSQFLSGHAASGGSTQLFIGFFLEAFNTGFCLEPSLLAKYSSLGVALDFDIYGTDDEPGAP